MPRGALKAVGIGMLLLVISAFIPGGHASGAPSLSGSPMQWAYGGAGNFSYLSNGTPSLPLYVDMHVWGLTEVVVTEANTSSHTVAIQVERAFAGVYFLEFCEPNCSQNALSPPTVVNMTFRGWGYENLFANFTDQATVSMGGQSLPALGLLNSSVESAGNVTVTENMSMPGGGGMGGVSSQNMTLYASTQLTGGHAAMSFSPALGILPLNATFNLGDIWSSTSQFSADAGGQASYHYDLQYPSSMGMPPQEGTGNVPVTFPSSGSITMTGGFLVDLDLLQGQVTVALTLDYAGAPVDALEGLILVPQMLDLFGPDVGALMGDTSSSGGSGSSTSGSGAMNASTGATDVEPRGSGVGLVGSETGYGGSTSGASTAGAALFPTVRVLSGVEASHASAEQNQPESVSQATQAAGSAGITIPPASNSLGQAVPGGNPGSENGGAGLGNPWISGVNLYLVIGTLLFGIATLVLFVNPRRRKGSTRGPIVPGTPTPGVGRPAAAQLPPNGPTGPVPQRRPPEVRPHMVPRSTSPVLTNLGARVQRYARLPPGAREPERQAILRGAEALKWALPASEHAEIYRIIAPVMWPESSPSYGRSLSEGAP